MMTGLKEKLVSWLENELRTDKPTETTALGTIQ